MCILLKLGYAKFGVSNLFFFKSSQRKTFGGSARSPPPLCKGRVNTSYVKETIANFVAEYEITVEL